MRRSSAALPGPEPTERHDWQTLKSLFPFIWAYKGRVIFAFCCLLAAKGANVTVPIVFKHLIDDLSITREQAFIVVPASLLLAYGVFRFSTSLFTELREIVFARVTQQAVREISLRVFRHLHALSLRFHLERQTGGLTRDIERGTRSIGSLISYTLYSILPTLIEIGLVIGILLVQYDAVFALITLAALVAYIGFTVQVTNWRTTLRRQANEFDSAANARAIDSLINYETVKYFNNEEFEARRYDEQLGKWIKAQITNQYSLSGLNIGQAAIVAVAVTAMMWQAAIRVASGEMTIGDIVLVNAFLIQLYIPLNFLGVIYREIRQALTDIERMFGLMHQHREIADAPDAQTLPPGPAGVRFENVCFAYDAKRSILFDVAFDIPAGRTVAVVGHSGSGKSTLARLLYRFYDVQGGAIRVNGHDIRQLGQDSLRAAIGIVPQDTVLFNDTLFYNIQYGRPSARREEVEAVARAAQLEDFIRHLPDGYETRVGERGLKLSGGEKQRVAIARALLKNPAILIFDEATSALDSKTEKAIQAQIERAAKGRTALVIAHRLSTIMDADEIIVLDGGCIVERGRHGALLANGGAYAQMWMLQKQEEAGEPRSGASGDPSDAPSDPASR
ncbi:ABCB family ABC transporter ATP-binding protein/permease [Thauera linaloolentis]|uniref:Composite transport ATP-binding permase n=1 Tax=Thauera linaloolentis (strain DSM 12138 / JCM 21573 / CCUG 41526 / CIP 105981 / IAM 15112 / NBRC 102519 / 47Lol) TaxID=1123367 RepID=N6Z5J0_THAL4|nr:ABC transporter ATP-binding protein/permease [Thauera linaloolentis]ENO89688.1 composite transport ATP-binding permase [Thauera linaloolentis 47Lol = DSM 12138]MCM8567168.1 ABC transporter ATP-binding protein/permease [Thauera linaloolentis]